MAAPKYMTLDDLLGTNDQTYTWRVPSKERDVKLRRLTHGEVNDLNQQWRQEMRITEEMIDRIVAMGLVEPAATSEQLRDAVGGHAMIAELYTQIASECKFITVLPAGKPQVYIPGDLHADDAALIDQHFTIVHEARPVANDAGPLPPNAATGSASS